MGLMFRMVNWMFSVRLLSDRLATLEPSMGLTRVPLSNDASCKKKTKPDLKCEFQHWYDHSLNTKNLCEMIEYLEEGRFGVEGELDPAGLLLLLGTETRGEGGGQEYRPRNRPWAPEPRPAEGAELHAQKVSHWVRKSLVFPVPEVVFSGYVMFVC